jgi:hypothetical protein
VILVDFAGFDGLESFPRASPEVQAVTYGLHLDRAAVPVLISNADATRGLASFGPENGYLRFGEDGAWWMPGVDVAESEFFGPVRVTADSIADAVPVVVSGTDPRLVALLADNTLTDMNVVPLEGRGEGTPHTVPPNIANLWGQRDPEGAVAYGFSVPDGVRHELLGARTVSSEPEAMATLPGYAQSAVFGDFDGDGATDAAVMTQDPDGVIFLFGSECAP